MPASACQKQGAAPHRRPARASPGYARGLLGGDGEDVVPPLLSSTQHYAEITPNTLTRACRDAGYFERNVRTIEVLINRDAVTSGQAAAGEPWQHYDLGHGLCSYTFFEQCPHRMACAKCDFYTPKSSTTAQLLEAKDNLQRTLVSIPLTDDERAAVDDGQTALDQLLQRLADVATPSGPTPRQLRAEPGRPLPLIVESSTGRPERKCC